MQVKLVQALCARAHPDIIHLVEQEVRDARVVELDRPVNARDLQTQEHILRSRLAVERKRVPAVIDVILMQLHFAA